MTHPKSLPTPVDRHILFVFTRWSGERAAVDDFFDTVHTPQALAIAGIVGIQRYVVADTKPLPGTNAIDHGHATVYEIEGDLDSVQQQLAPLLSDGTLPGPIA